MSPTQVQGRFPPGVCDDANAIVNDRHSGGVGSRLCLSRK